MRHTIIIEALENYHDVNNHRTFKATIDGVVVNGILTLCLDTPKRKYISYAFHFYNSEIKKHFDYKEIRRHLLRLMIERNPRMAKEGLR